VASLTVPDCASGQIGPTEAGCVGAQFKASSPFRGFGAAVASARRV
jgi:hypothetical protein